MRRPVVRAFEVAAGSPPVFCPVCGGLPYPMLVRIVGENVACEECFGRLDEEGRPCLRFPLPVGFRPKRIVLAEEEE